MNLRILLASLLILVLSSCATRVPPEPVVITETEYVFREIPLQDRPPPVSLLDINFYAVTRENLDEFLERFENENGVVAFFALSVPDYEDISLNVAELKRYIESQEAIILYYEENINSPEE